jgi:protein-disulfide isomerase
MRPAAALLLSLACGALSACGGAAVTQTAETNKALNVPPAEELMQPGPLGERALGSPNAPVTVIEYVSLTCPHCAAFQRDVFPRVKKEYIDTGKIRFIVREFPIGRSAGNAAIANRCAPEDKYFTLLTNLLARQPEWVSQEVRLDAIYGVAKSVGMSRETFDKCLANQGIIDGLNEVKQRGRKFGVIGTPTFFANGRKAQGATTYEEFRALVDPQSSS